MNWDEIKGKWTQVKGQARAKWGDLTDDEIEQMKGERDQIVGKVQERYGRTREQAEAEVDDWARTISS